MSVLMFIFAVIAVVAAIVTIVMVNVKKEEFTSKAVLIPAATFLVSMILAIVFYTLV